jgi:phospholipid/cholesterol/gamma-HCH transport system substrate-binding protein
MTQFKVGLLALSAMLSIVIMSFMVTSNQSGFGEYVTYRTIVDDASGIFPKTPIKVAGITAGRIKKIELQGHNALITFEILQSVRVTKGSKLRIKSVGFLGDKYLEIVLNKGEDREVENGLIVADAGTGFEKIVDDAATVLKDVKEIVSGLKNDLRPPGEVSPLKSILDDFKELMSNAKDVTKSLKSVVSDNEEKLNSLISNLEEFSENLNYQMDHGHSDSAISDIKKILANVDDMTEDMKSIIADVRKGKGTLGKVLVEEEIADEVKQTLASVKKMVGKVDAIRTELAVFTGANTVSGAETEASLKIFPSPERFYLLGISTSEFGPEKQKHLTSTVNGVETTEVRSEKEKDALRFNLQVGRVLQNWVFRGGLIESSGGLGIDYMFPSIGLKVGTEAFDYRDSLGVNWRFYTDMRIWNVFYGKVAAEDVINTTRSFTFSAGLKFNDEDLKGLIGFFL